MAEITENTSGQGKLSVVPNEIRGWNWGAFLFNWIWGIGNNVWIALLALIPWVNIVMVFVLGVKGSEWAWQSKRWNSVEHFKKTQSIWTKVAIGITIGVILINVIVFIVIFALAD